MSTDVRPPSPPALAPKPPSADLGEDPVMRMLLPVGRSGWAIAAGYAGLFAVLIFPAPIALVLSIVAIIHIRRHPDKHGMGRAIFGLIMGALFPLLLLVIITVLILEP